MSEQPKNLSQILTPQFVDARRPLEFSPAVVCSICDGAGWVESEGRMRRCECLKSQIRSKRQAAFDAEIPNRFRNCSRETWEGPWPLVKADSWIPQPGKNPWAMVVWGPPGTGKTHAATALYRGLLARFEHLTGMWLSNEEMLTRVKSEFGDRAVTKENLERVDLLLLDDVGRAKESPFTLDLTRSLLYLRHLNQLPTIITSNAQKITDFDAIDPALSDRLSINEGAIHANFAKKANYRLKGVQG